MLEYMEYLSIPTTIVLVFVAVFFVINVIGEVLEFCGKVVPEFCKIRKYFARRKEEREEIREMFTVVKCLQERTNKTDEMGGMKQVFDAIERLEQSVKTNDMLINELSEKLNKNNEDTLSMLIESKRNAIISFASNIVDANTPVTRESFARIFRIHVEYENLIDENGLTNGEVDIAYRIIAESYNEHIRNHTFIEDIRGW